MNGTELENLRAQLAASAEEQNRLNAVAHEQFMQLAAKDAELKKVQSAARMGMNAAKSHGVAALAQAEKLSAEISPDAIESEREANKLLTDENERLQAELAQCRQAIDVLRRIKAWDIDNYALDIPLDIRREMQKVIELYDAAISQPPQEQQ